MMKRPLMIGVFGSGDNPIPKGIARKARIIGEEIAKSSGVLITGACSGVPAQALTGVKRYKGQAIGFSPALNMREHRKKYKLPFDAYSTLIFTGSDFVSRDIINCRAVEAGIIISGKTGTLNELSILMEDGNIIGILEGTGGCADLARRIHKKLWKKYLKYVIIFEKDPRKLVAKIMEEIKKRRKKERT